ncbi:MAG: autotransporter-associated beta strand repeat-containing protein [Kiritimatiellia bacterium]
MIVLKRGAFEFRGAGGRTETIGRIDVETWGVLGAWEGNTDGILTLSDPTAGLTRGSTGSGMAMVHVNASGAPLGNFSVPNGIETDTLLPWIATSRGSFMYVDSADNNTLKQVAVSEAATNVTTWTSLYDATSNVRVGNDSSVALAGALDGSLTLKSLGFFNNSATTLDLGATNTLTLASGGIAFYPGSWGAHQTLANGALASGSGTLHLHSGDSSMSTTLILSSPIVGADTDVVKAGVGQVEFRGTNSNTYGGTTIVNGGNLLLDKTDGAIAIPGPLVVRYGGSVDAHAGNINPTADVTIESGGLIYAQSQTYSGVLKLTGGTLLFPNAWITLNHATTPGLVFNGGWINYDSSWYGGIHLQTDVRYESTAETQARFERLEWNYPNASYNIRLNGGNRTFDIADSATLPADVPEMVVDTAIVDGSPAGGALTKTGAGVLQLSYTNSYTGGTTVNGGTLRVAKITAPAQSGLSAYTVAGIGSHIVTFTQPVARDMVVGQQITGSTIPTNRTVTVARVLNDCEIMTNGENVNGASTNVAVAAVSRAGSLGTGPATVNNAATLEIDDGIALANDVTVNAGGTIAASGAGLGSLVVDGGTVSARLAKGPLAMTGALSLDDATLAVDSLPGDEPVTILSAAGGVTGKFTSIPDKVTVRYHPTSVTVSRLKGTLVMVQ